MANVDDEMTRELDNELLDALQEKLTCARQPHVYVHQARGLEDSATDHLPKLD